MDARLLKMLVCPEDRTPLDLAEPQLMDRLNRAVAARQVRNRSGQLVERRLEAGLVRKDGAVLYPVIDGIPSLLVDEAIPLAQLEE